MQNKAENNHNVISVFFACDEKYVPYVSTAIASVCDNTQHPLNIYVIDGGITEHSKKMLTEFVALKAEASLQILTVNTNIFKDMKVNQLSVSAFCRFLIPWVVPDLDRAVYLDSDVMVLRDIADLFNQDLRGKALAACPDMGREPREQLLSVNKNYISFDKNHIYFNSGVLVIDCQKWRENNIIDDLIALEAKYRYDMIFMDQDVLNKYFDNNYTTLSIEYNFMPHMKEVCKNGEVENITCEMVKEVEKHCRIIHFAGPIKPWESKWCFNNGEFEKFWYYANKTPFGAGLTACFIEKNIVNNTNRGVNDIRWSLDEKSKMVAANKAYKFLGVFPLLTIKTKYTSANKIKQFVKIMGIPFYSKIQNVKNVRYKLFGIIPVLKINEK